MDLWATGFNAWRQLEFEEPENSPDEPDDLTIFKRVLRGGQIEHPVASLTFTLVRTASGLRQAGFVEEGIESSGLRQKLLSSTAAIAGSGMFAEYDGTDVIFQYASMLDRARLRSAREFTGMGQVVQMAAYETGFIALSDQGCVWSWGDERYATCLGREVTRTSPAGRPGIIEDLCNLPTGKIKKITAAGYHLFALTEGNDLYGWGGHPGRRALIEGLSTIPVPILIEDSDVVDCSAGESHVIALTSDGNVYVIGDNTNGQLGLSVDEAKTWTKVSLRLERYQCVVGGVHAGPRSSFILTKHQIL